MSDTMSVLAKVRRDVRLPPRELAAKAMSLAAATVTGPIYLRECTKVGPFVRTFGRPAIRNEGRIEIGAHVAMKSDFAPVMLETGPQGVIQVGAGAHLNFGVMVSAERSVIIGEEAHLAPYSIVCDSDGAGDARPIVIGARAWIASRATILPGARIGDGAVVTAGSVVSGVIPPDTVAAGIPARILRRKDAKKLQPPADLELEELLRVLQPDAWPPLRVDGVALAWTTPGAALPSFQRAQRLEAVTDDELRADVDAFVAKLRTLAEPVLAPAWTLPLLPGLGDARPGGVARALAVANLRLMDAATGGIFVVPAEQWPRAIKAYLRELAS